MKTNFRVKLTLGECNGFMSSEWFVNDQHITTLETNTTEAFVEFFVDLPCVITIKLSNKNLETDTLVDHNGQVIKDKFIKIDNMWLARRFIPEHVFSNMCEIQTVDKKFTSSYFGFPGTVNIHINEADPILWHFKNNHYKIS